MRPRLAIIIINFRTPDLTIDCLRSLTGEVALNPGVRTVVIDNHSSDDSPTLLSAALAAEKWGWCTLIESPQNSGFAGGNNLGIRAIEADNYLLLNSDTVVRPGAITALLDAADKYPAAGVIGPRLEWPDARPQESCFHDLRPAHAFTAAAQTGLLERLIPRSYVGVPVSETPLDSDWTSFACALIRREVFEKIGLLDTGYFMYFDDVDFCRRARAAGWKILHWPAARVVHLRGKSGPVKSAGAARKQRPRYYYVSRARYYAKFYGTPGLWLANSLWMLGRCVSWLRELLRTKQPHTCRRELLDNWINATHPNGPRSWEEQKL